MNRGSARVDWRIEGNDVENEAYNDRSGGEEQDRIGEVQRCSKRRCNANVEAKKTPFIVRNDDGEGMHDKWKRGGGENGIENMETSL